MRVHEISCPWSARLESPALFFAGRSNVDSTPARPDPAIVAGYAALAETGGPGGRRLTISDLLRIPLVQRPRLAGPPDPYRYLGIYRPIFIGLHNLKPGIPLSICRLPFSFFG